MTTTRIPVTREKSYVKYNAENIQSDLRTIPALLINIRSNIYYTDERYWWLISGTPYRFVSRRFAQTSSCVTLLDTVKSQVLFLSSRSLFSFALSSVYFIFYFYGHPNASFSNQARPPGIIGLHQCKYKRIFGESNDFITYSTFYYRPRLLLRFSSSRIFIQTFPKSSVYSFIEKSNCSNNDC